MPPFPLRAWPVRHAGPRCDGLHDRSACGLLASLRHDEEEGSSSPMEFRASRDWRLFAALFLVALATVMFEVLLTRIFSLTMWYHFAFMAISVAMFGMTVGALLVFLRPGRWPDADLLPAMGRCASFAAIAMVTVILLHISLYLPDASSDIVPLVLTFVAVAIPFVFSGVFVSLSLTRFPAGIGSLYAVDLAGAAIGCLAVIVALHWLDGVGAVLACAALASLGGTFLLSGKQRAAALVLTGLLGGTALWSGAYLARHGLAAFKIAYPKGAPQEDLDYESWNSFSRIAVLKPEKSAAVAWNLSTEYKNPVRIESRWLQIDSIAGTQLIGFDGDMTKIDFLRWDLPNFVQHLRRGARIAIVGAGGGRDVLTAKLFGQKRVVAVEVNGDTMRVVNGRFGNFTGHLDRDPGVTFVNDEARSYLARQQDRFDIIQVAFVDTFAATAAGAYTLTENSLYTAEGWKVFLDRLDDHGILAVSRGVSPELYRLVSLGRAALLNIGAPHPEQHMVLVTNRHRTALSVYPMGLLLVSRAPFAEADLARIRELARTMNYDIDLQPEAARDALLRALATGHGMEEVIQSGPVNYAAPTDDRPFFFNMARPSAWLLMRGGESSPASGAAALLGALLLTVIVLTLTCIVLPLAVARTRLERADAAFLGFFAAIGIGFMLIEVSMLQRLIVFLGHPVYSLSVILFVLLITGGVGSYLSRKIVDHRLPATGTKVLAAVVAVLAGAGFATPRVVSAFTAAETPTRIVVSAALLAVMGVFMGTAFPLGMRLATRARPALAPWLWGVNGAMSVLASVLAVVIAMAVGIAASFWTGVAAYVFAIGSFALAVKPKAAAGASNSG